MPHVSEVRFLSATETNKYLGTFEARIRKLPTEPAGKEA